MLLSLAVRKPFLLKQLRHGTKRYGELKRTIDGVSHNVNRRVGG